MTTILDEVTWRTRQRRHEDRVDDWVAPHLARRRQGLAHPVEDFLFTYYSHRPSALRRWHPGVGVTLTGPGVQDFAGRSGYVVRSGTAYVDPNIADGTGARVRWIRDLLAATSSRPAQLGCFGLHEWAMVYRQPRDETRHSHYPLRLGPGGTDEVVESHRISCTHFDAFRFFTEPARPRNTVQPARDTQLRNEQPGCLHTSMDLYKWAYKLTPLVASELVADCFALAREVRHVDMQAAPYDLSELGVEPIRIETQDGKAAYIARQQDFATRAGRLRSLLVEVCDAALCR